MIELNAGMAEIIQVNPLNCDKITLMRFFLSDFINLFPRILISILDIKINNIQRI